MNVRITPSQACGTVQAPPSKSMGHRALLCGALTGGSVIKNLSYSKDIEATLNCLQALGANVKRDGNSVTIGGLDPFLLPHAPVLPCNESGSTLRFLIPLCMLCGDSVTLKGSDRLFQRPLTLYEEIAQKQNICWWQDANSVTVCGKLKSGEYRVRGDVSSQFITGLLYALPLLEGDSTLTVTGKFESASYIDLTLSALAGFGIRIYREGSVFHIPGGQTFQSREYTVEGDCSNAAFLEGLNLLGSSVDVTGLKADTLQGDRVYKEMFSQLGASEKPFDLSDCPDLGPVMFAMAAVKGGAVFTGVARLRIKESDRIGAMAQELAKFGIRVTADENTATVHPGTLQTPTEPLCGHNDHRIVMSMALLCTVTGGTVSGCEAVSKSFPDFFEQLEKLHIGVEFI